MRRAVTVSAAALLVLSVAGCAPSSPSNSGYYVSPQILGTRSSGESLDTTLTPQSGVDNSTFPRAAFGNDPSAAQITVATGPTAISRDKAIELTSKGAAFKDATLVSAVHVTLPTAFMRVVLSDPKKAKPTSAWVVTFTGVAITAYGGHVIRAAPGGARSTQVATPTAEVPGTAPAYMATSVIDATTGELLYGSDYPGPQ
jgi:hypothetical protein